jgi:hypothetical protein
VQSATATNASISTPQAVPSARFFDTYGVSYAFGLLFLLPSIILIGSQPLYSFNAFYTAMLTIPPIAASLLLLATEPTAEGRSHLLRRGLLLVVLATTGSILALIVGTPVVIFLFLNKVGHSQTLTAIVSASGLAFVSAPMVWSLISHIRAGAWIRVTALLLGIAAMVVVILLTLSSSGFLVESMRRDQGEIMMGLLEWCLPAFAVTTALLRRDGVV